MFVALGHDNVESEKHLGEMSPRDLRYFDVDDRGPRYCYQQQKQLGPGSNSSRQFSRRRR